MTFAGRKEPLIVGVVILDGAIAAGIAGWLFYEAATGRLPAFNWAVGAFAILGFVLASWILLGTSYEIEDGRLEIRRGPVKSRIPLSAIDEVFSTTGNPLSPAWAKGRLQILFVPGHSPGTLFLSPDDPTAFLEGLASADSGLAFSGEKVARRPPA